MSDDSSTNHILDIRLPGLIDDWLTDQAKAWKMEPQDVYTIAIAQACMLWLMGEANPLTRMILHDTIVGWVRHYTQEHHIQVEIYGPAPVGRN